MCADDDELYAEIMWCRKRRDMPADLPPLTDRTRPPTRDDFFHSLLDTEKTRYENFLSQHNVDLCVISLGQDPLWTRAASGEDTLHTLVRNPGLLWMEEYGRWQSVRYGLNGLPPPPWPLNASMISFVTFVSVLEAFPPLNGSPYRRILGILRWS